LNVRPSSRFPFFLAETLTARDAMTSFSFALRFSETDDELAHLFLQAFRVFDADACAESLLA